MSAIQQVHCPNCGSFAERHHLDENQITRTQCGKCDYLLVMCNQTNRVIESYAPGLSYERLICNYNPERFSADTHHHGYSHNLSAPQVVAARPITALPVRR